MQHHVPTAWPVQAEPFPDLVTDLVGVLATVLRLKAEKIDPDQTFRSLGLDSLLTVEFVATVNSRYGTTVRPDILLDHPTPLAFTRHLAREGAAGPSLPAPSHPGSRPDARTAPAAAPASASGGPAPRTAGSVTGPVLEALREELARILCCDPWDLDTAAPFAQLGVDSIIGAEFVATVNEIYGLDERPVMLYDHPSLSAVAAHVTEMTTAADPAARPSGVEALLDAVADNRLTIDEALVLLSRSG
ncbi:acyl carrier protein [Streptomyces sp. NPDC005012]|uniref:acyl carrier protein n=1 Tax=unclassified Streptomyces TaxID=2593676 RepID=UPI0033BC1546